mmetsp:Transcript_371/g.1271  ORF Transcript_371/g.1271 Transcript_371/m.1271 type:complete len:934 (+) Transcript_371:88-2889(+)
MGQIDNNEDPDAHAREPFQRGGEKDISAGPVQERHCTDMICIIIFAAAWVGYIFLTFANAGAGNPQKLYRPRDFRGSFCALEDQWASDISLKNQEKLTYMMNVTAAVDQALTQMLCAEATADSLRAVLSTADLADYECKCCLTPCDSCYSAWIITQYAGLGEMEADVINRLQQLSTSTGLTSSGADSLFNPAGSNGELFRSIFYGDSPYFVKVCTSSCSETTVDDTRIYRWQPPGDHPLRNAWDAASQNSIISTDVFDAFSFKAVGYGACPYEDRYCVPWPGVEFDEMDLGHCEFKMTQDVISVIGSSAAGVLEEDGVRAVREDMGATLGDAVGDFTDTLDAFAVTALCGFLLGLVFLVLLRFCVGFCVWFSILVVFLLILAAGLLAWLRSGQCAGAGLFDSGKEASQAIASAAESAIDNSGVDLSSETLTGAGGDYRGAQKKTTSGKTCMAWSSTSSYTVADYPDAGLTSNYCRNPGEEAPTIWCFTTDPEVRWETCTPLFVFQDECHEGYEVSNKDMRKALEYTSYVIWGLSFLFLVTICCMFKAIRLAIAVNKVAAMFVYHKPQVLLVPMVQVVIVIVWCLLWALSVSFLVSQVAEDHVPKDYYATYFEAFGTEESPGACTGIVPQGFVWKDEGDFTAVGNPCSGDLGDISGIVPKCWRCGQPRYTIDWKVWCSFFVYLWNNAFLIAVGQCTIAGACAAWFFAPKDEKRSVNAVTTGLWNCFRYHLGSLAFGAFIIALVQFIRYVMKYFEKQAQAQKNYLCAAILKVAQCLVACFERCIKFLNRNAYIQIALLGKNFCTSAKNALMLILRNFRRFAAVVTLGSVIQFVGWMFICAGTTVLGYFIVKGLHPETSPAVPVALYFIMSYFIAQLYMNVFGLATDTMLQCFIATEEMGGDEDFVPGPLKTLLPAGPKQDAVKAGAEPDDPGSTE